MAAIPPFLNALELDTDADERAIRRAYAKRLKRIDQEADPAGFQALRETFETALKWVALQPKRSADLPAMAPVARPVIQVAAPTPPPPPPAPPIVLPRPSGPPTLRVVRDTPSTAADAAAQPLEWPTLPEAEAAPTRASAPTPPAVSSHGIAQAFDEEPAPAVVPPPPRPAAPRARPPGAAPLSADTPTLSLLQDAKLSLARSPSPSPSPAPSPTPARGPASASAQASKPATAQAPVPVPALAMASDENPADLVFADFLKRFNRIADDEAVVTREIAAALADPRLVNLDARAAFEGHVARLIMGGWKPGHEFLFKPACDAFEWERDRRRLETYGPMGAVLDAAIRERLMFIGQTDLALDPQRKLMRRLRTDKPLRPAEIAPSIQMLSMLLQRYPNWMRVMTRQDVVQHWIDTWNAFTPEQRQAGAPSWTPKTSTATKLPTPAKPFKAKASSSGSPFGGFGSVLWIVIMVIGAISRMGGSSNGGTTPAPYQAPPAIPLRVTTVPQIPATPNFGNLPAQPEFPSPYVSGNRAPDLYGDPATQPSSPADDARRQAAAERLERKQQQIDEMYAKRALRNGQGGSVRYDEQGVPVPDPNVIQGQAPQQ
jgi:protein TonB